MRLEYPILLSLISALRFGWRGIENGAWLTDALRRVVCGIQSVISKYLILLFLLKYFGGLFRD
jgi:hypothetical protein